MDILLKAKHWQLFALSIGASIFFEIIDALFPSVLGVYSNLKPFLSLIFVLGFLLWLWQIVLRFNTSKTSEVARDAKYFKLTFLFIMVFVFSTTCLQLFAPPEISRYADYGVPLLLFAFLYCIVFTARLLKEIEVRREVSSNEYFGDLFLFFMIPIGIWILQPKINKLFAGKSISYDPTEVTETFDNDNISETSRKAINRLCGYGILLFLVGLIGLNWIVYLNILIPLGTVMTFLGSFFFLRDTNFKKEFYKDPGTDYITYFWNKLILKTWTAMFILAMVIVNLDLINELFK